MFMVLLLYVLLWTNCK